MIAQIKAKVKKYLALTQINWMALQGAYYVPYGGIYPCYAACSGV